MSDSPGHAGPVRRGAVFAFGSTAALLTVIGLPQARAQQGAPTSENIGALEEVVVTARRREEPLARVPISISTFDAAEMDARGVKVFQDLVRLTPGLNMLEDQATGANRIYIRGIASSAGASTTGVYIDDTPIQAIRLGTAAGTTYPGLFDVERVEILRGPQGTLYGAGSEGGTVRFITPEPGLLEATGYARSEVATLEHGSPSYEAGLAYGGPLVSDIVGYRISAYYRREGGWIDLVDGTYKIVDPTGALYGNSVAFTRTSTLDQDVNWNRTESVRVALKYAPTSALTLTPALFYGLRHANDGAGNFFDLSTSNSGAHDYSRQGYRQGVPGTLYEVTTADADGVARTQPLTLNALNVPDDATDDDQFRLWSLAVNWDTGPVRLVSNSAYFDRENTQWYDATEDYAALLSEAFLEPDRVTSTGIYAPPGWKAMTRYGDTQGNFVEELRVQSNDSAARFRWVVGGFYSHQNQSAAQTISENFVIYSPWIGFVPTAYGEGYYAVGAGPPFYSDCGVPGPCTAAQNFFGADMLPNAASFQANWHRTDQQYAGYAQADYRIGKKWDLTLGLRISRHTLDFSAAYLGPENNSNAPLGGDPAGHGSDCPTAPAPCAFGSGPLAPVTPSSATSSSSTATTPKYGVSYQLNDANMFYASAAKGFRPAGASLRAPPICNPSLKQIGYVDANGNAVQPTTYDPDSVWSYEIGSKNRLFGGRLVIDSSVYEIKWSNIQLTVNLDCGVSFVDNLANATSKGFDLGFEFKPTDSLDFEGALGYIDATFDQDATSPNGEKVIYNGGSAIPNVGAPWTVSLSANYARPLANRYRGYARVDYTWSSEWRRYGATDPGTASYDPLLKPTPAYNLLNLRLGTQFRDFDLDVFVNNLTNSAPNVRLWNEAPIQSQDWHGITVRPRTYGLTLSWHM